MKTNHQNLELVATLSFRTPVFTRAAFTQYLQSPCDLRNLAEVVTCTELKSYLESRPDWLERGAREIEWIKAHSGSLLYPGHPSYPDSFSILEDPPVALTVLGHASWVNHRCLSVVGSREPTSMTHEWLQRELALLLQRYGSDICLVSGGARGADQLAHEAALKNNKPTVAFLPSGLAEFYPSSFLSYLDPIIESGGAVVSELSPFALMEKHYFERRNRLIAAISKATLVVQARRRSGTMITARQALKNHRTVGVVPGFPGDPNWGGSVDLLTDGAVPIRDASDLSIFMSL